MIFKFTQIKSQINNPNQANKPAGHYYELATRYAHRGYHDKPEIPENSIAAFKRAIEYGFASELDVHLIADGSLVVFHDELLERETGVIGEIEDYDLTNLRKLRLEGTDEMIPTFDEVLELYENSGLELLIELKVARGNYKELARKVCERLDSYKGSFVIESFDPRSLMEVRKLRPEICIGQLAQDFIKKGQRESLPLYQAFLLTNLRMNMLVKPDFVAYRFADRGNRSLRRLISKAVDYIGRGQVREASWTIRKKADYDIAIREGSVPIFERFNPDIHEGNRKDDTK